MDGLACNACTWNRVGDRAIETSAATSFATVAISTLTSQVPTAASWVSKVKSQSDGFKSVGIDAVRARHNAWWDAFWQRSWISVPSEVGVPPTETVSAQHAFHRFIIACQGRPKDIPAAMIK